MLVAELLNQNGEDVRQIEINIVLINFLLKEKDLLITMNLGSVAANIDLLAAGIN